MEKTADPFLKFLPPQNIEAEEALISAILIDNQVIEEVVSVIASDDFYKSAHQRIFQAIRELYDRNDPVDLVTLANKLKAMGVLEEVGGASYLARIIESAPVAINAAHYAGIVSRKAYLRRLIGTSNRIIMKSYRDADTDEDVMDFAERTIMDLAQDRKKTAYVRLGAMLEENIEQISQRMENRALYTGIPSGFNDLDQLTSGFQGSDLIILAARPSMGKTALALNIARNAAVDANVPVAIFSFEMSSQQLSMRLLSAEAHVNLQRLRDGYLTHDDMERLHRAGGVLEQAPIYLDDSSDITPVDIRAKSRRLKKKEGIGMIIIDYLQLMNNDRTRERRDLEIAEISRSLKQLAKELRVPVIALSQLKREVDTRTNKRPQLGDLRESGSLEQDADLVAFIYRDEVYNKDPGNPNRGIAEIILAKHRNGPTDSVNLAFVGAHTAFHNLETRRQ